MRPCAKILPDRRQIADLLHSTDCIAMSFYRALPRSEDSSDADSLEGNLRRPTEEKKSSLGTWTVAVCILCTLVNLGTTALYPPVSPIVATKPLESMTPNDVRLLRRPNQYIGLEKVSRPIPPEPRSFTNYPIVILPVDSANPRMVFEHEPKRHLTQVGTITPEERRVAVTDTLSTIVQFRAIDFGMESCELNIHLPPSAKLPNTPPSSAIAVHRMNTTYALDTTTLSYATRPPRLPKLADIPFHPTENIHWHRKFVCPTESVLTFELTCSTSTGHSCNIEWWQDKAPEIAEADAAIFVTQHATA